MWPLSVRLTPTMVKVVLRLKTLVNLDCCALVNQGRLIFSCGTSKATVIIQKVYQKQVGEVNIM